MLRPARPQQRDFRAYQTKVLDICFDEKSLLKFSTGLKMIVANGEPALFVKVERLKKKTVNSARSFND